MKYKTKEDITRSAAQKLGIPQAVVVPVFDAILAEMAICLKQDDPIQFRQFGTFLPKTIPERMARNPRTGAPVTVKASKAVRFAPAKLLREYLEGTIGGPTAVFNPKLQATINYLTASKE